MEEAKSFSDGIFTETEDEGFYGGPNKSTTNIGWLVGTPNVGKSAASAHIDIYETGQAKPPPYLNVKEVPGSGGYNLSRSKSVCDLSIEQNSQLLNCSSEKSFTIERKRMIERKPNPEQPHRSRVVRNRTILGSFPLFYKLSQSLSSLNTKSEISSVSQIMGSPQLMLECGGFYNDVNSDSR